MVVGGDHVDIGSGEFYFLQGFERTFGIAREIDDEGGFRMPLQVLQDADVEVGGDLGILGDHFRVFDVDQGFANAFTEMLVGGRD